MATKISSVARPRPGGPSIAANGQSVRAEIFYRRIFSAARYPRSGPKGVSHCGSAGIYSKKKLADFLVVAPCPLLLCARLPGGGDDDLRSRSVHFSSIGLSDSPARFVLGQTPS